MDETHMSRSEFKAMKRAGLIKKGEKWKK